MGASGSSYTQANRMLSISTPLGTDALLLHSLNGHEGISRLFSYQLDLLAYQNASITFSDIVGQNVTITINLADGTPRYINGYVSKFAQAETDDRYFTRYTAEVVPWLWFLTRSSDCRIYQNLAVPDIISQVFGLFSSVAKFDNKTTTTYPTLEYCVQYRETAFNFVSRLMEENGIFYYFDHTTQGQHTMVLADASSVFVNCPDVSTAPYSSGGGVDNQDVVTAWHVEQELRTGKYTVNDYNFTTPSTSLLSSAPTVVDLTASKPYELFDYPGLYETASQGTSVAKLRIEEEEATYMVVTGSSTCRWLASGYTFTLEDHDRSDQNTSYIITEVQHSATAGETYLSETTETESYSNHFTCIPATGTYRPARVTPKPFVQGLQSAVVVGPSGEEIYTDKYGRIKVQFIWDRQGQNNENSSCWIRVAQVWAGATWGALFLPRIGQEVVVDFEEGDPDRPIITGSVYNANMMPPGTQPTNMNISGFRTRSTKNGGSDAANVLTFDDTAGSEVYYMRAEKDMAIRVQNNQDLHVYNDQTITVDQDRTETVTNGNENVTIKSGTRTHTVSGNDSLTVQQGDRSVTVSTGKDSLTVSTGDRVVMVSTGNDTHTVSTGNRSVTVSTGNDSLTVSLGNQSTTVSAGSASTTAMQSITLTCGGSSITISPSSIEISAPSITISGESEVQVSGAMINVEADGILGLTGSMTNINS